MGKNMEDARKEKRASISVSLTESERDELMEIANEHGLSVSAFIRPVAKEHGAAHGHIVERMKKHDDERMKKHDEE